MGLCRVIVLLVSGSIQGVRTLLSVPVVGEVPLKLGTQPLLMLGSACLVLLTFAYVSLMMSSALTLLIGWFLTLFSVVRVCLFGFAMLVLSISTGQVMFKLECRPGDPRVPHGRILQGCTLCMVFTVALDLPWCLR